MSDSEDYDNDFADFDIKHENVEKRLNPFGGYNDSSEQLTPLNNELINLSQKINDLQAKVLSLEKTNKRLLIIQFVHCIAGLILLYVLLGK